MPEPEAQADMNDNIQALMSLLPQMEEALGAENPELADYLTSIGLLLYHESRFDEAEIFLDRALVIRDRVLAVDHPDIGSAMNNLAMVYLAQTKLQDAEPLFRQALTIQEKVSV